MFENHYMWDYNINVDLNTLHNHSENKLNVVFKERKKLLNISEHRINLNILMYRFINVKKYRFSIHFLIIKKK